MSSFLIVFGLFSLVVVIAVAIILWVGKKRGEMFSHFFVIHNCVPITYEDWLGDIRNVSVFVYQTQMEFKKQKKIVRILKKFGYRLLEWREVIVFKRAWLKENGKVVTGDHDEISFPLGEGSLIALVRVAPEKSLIKRSALVPSP